MTNLMDAKTLSRTHADAVDQICGIENPKEPTFREKVAQTHKGIVEQMGQILLSHGLPIPN